MKYLKYLGHAVHLCLSWMDSCNNLLWKHSLHLLQVKTALCRMRYSQLYPQLHLLIADSRKRTCQKRMPCQIHGCLLTQIQKHHKLMQKCSITLKSCLTNNTRERSSAAKDSSYNPFTEMSIPVRKAGMEFELIAFLHALTAAAVISCLSISTYCQDLRSPQWQQLIASLIITMIFFLSIIGFPGVFWAKLHTLTTHKAQTLSKSLLPPTPMIFGTPSHPQNLSDHKL